MEYKKLSKQPLKFVLAEFKYSPILQIEEYLPSIQEAFRKNYPIFQTKSERVFRLYNNQAETFEIKRWAFISSNKSEAIEIDQERIIYFTSNYDRFDGFSTSCEKALEILFEKAQPSLIQRIGLRYCDLVSPNGDEKIENYVSKNLICPEEIIDLGTDKFQKNETILKTNVGTLVIRSYYGMHDLSYPPDLANRLPIAIRKECIECEKILLDFDHFWDTSNDSISFETTKIIVKLKELHSIARKAFFHLTTEYARSEQWA